MEKKSREKRERREGGTTTDQERLERIGEIERELNRLADGEYTSGKVSPNLSLEDRQNYLENILAFESVGSGPSLFEGLEANGVRLPRPEQLSDRQCIRKVTKIMKGLSKIGVFLMGFEHLNPRELYTTLFHQTLWEGCYVKRRHPGSVTFIDVSRRPHSKLVAGMRLLEKAQRVQ
jgi:hypothetical protein